MAGRETRDEIRANVQEFMSNIKLCKIFFDGVEAGTGDMLIDVLMEELEGMKPKAPENPKGMSFLEALRAMKDGHKVKLPSWAGYWVYDSGEDRIWMHCKDGKILEIRDTDRLSYTLENICSDEWIVADETNTPELGGVASFSFGEAIKYLKRGFRVRRQGWNGKGIYLELQVPDSHSKMTLPYIYIVTTGLVTDNPHAPKGCVPWLASQTDMLADDWVFAE